MKDGVLLKESNMAAQKYPDKVPGEFWGKVKSALGGKVDKVKGMGLSSNDYTAEDKQKVDSIVAIDDQQIDQLFGKE